MERMFGMCLLITVILLWLLLYSLSVHFWSTRSTYWLSKREYANFFVQFNVECGWFLHYNGILDDISHLGTGRPFISSRDKTRDDCALGGRRRRRRKHIRFICSSVYRLTASLKRICRLLQLRCAVTGVGWRKRSLEMGSVVALSLVCVALEDEDRRHFQVYAISHPLLAPKHSSSPSLVQRTVRRTG